MCIDDRWHGDWLKTHAWWEPSINIDKGAEIFASSNRMLGGYLPAMIAAYNCGPRKASRLLLGLNSQTSEEEKIVKLDAITTRNYVSGVLHILEAFKK
jgi:soluble lytic murein transglycosylase-like protein